ncbi:MAG: hypothetical protein QM808_18170 [Steroidobacteraceae bacterium]
MSRLLKTKTTQLTLAMAMNMAIAVACNVASANPITGALGETKPIIDVRARYEMVDQDPPPAALTDKANATTVRARLGAETGKAWSTALLAEGDFLTVIQDHYRSDPSVPGYAFYPVVADPEAYEVNRLQLTNTSITNTTITLGRQRITLDDQRFVGNVGWRMNEQTFDALRVVPKFLNNNLTVDVTYANRANRIYGPDSPQGAYKGDIILGNVAYQFRVGKLTGFAYFLDFDPITDFVTGAGLNATQKAGLNPARGSSETLGARFAGTYNISKIKLAYSASWANQKDYGSYKTSRPVGQQDFSNDYYAAEVIGTYRQYSLGAGVENLEGDGVQGFQTPLATLHKFQGWVDKFLSTPAKGINDQYLTAGITTKGIKPFETVSLSVMQHKYKSTMDSLDLGEEFNIQLSAKYSRVTGTLKYGDYHIGTPLQLVANTGSGATLVNNAFSTLADTKKFWAQLDFVW